MSPQGTLMVDQARLNLHLRVRPRASPAVFPTAWALIHVLSLFKVPVRSWEHISLARNPHVQRR